MNLRKVVVEPQTVVISRKRLERSRSNYIERSFSSQRPKLQYERAISGSQLPDIQKRAFRATSARVSSSALYQQLYPYYRLFKGSVLHYGRYLRQADTAVDKEEATKHGMYCAVAKTDEDRVAVALRNYFMDVRLRCVTIAKNLYVGTSLADSFRFVLEICRFVKMMRPSMRESDYKRLLGAIMEEGDLKMLLLGLVKNMVGNCVSAINTAVVLTYLLLDLDPRTIYLNFFKPLLRSLGTCFLSKVLTLTADQRAGEVASMMLAKLVAHNLISFAESGLIGTPRFLTDVFLEQKTVQGACQFAINKKIARDFVGIVMALKFSPKRFRELYRYVLTIKTTCTQDSNCFVCVFKRPADLEPDACVRDYARSMARILTVHGVKARPPMHRRLTQQSLQHDLRYYIQSVDFESFSQRNKLPLRSGDYIAFAYLQDPGVHVFKCEKSLLQISFDAYDGMTDFFAFMFATPACTAYEVQSVAIDRWKTLDPLPIPRFFAPMCCYRAKAAERAVLRKYGHPTPQSHIYLPSGGPIAASELAALLSNKRDDFAREYLAIPDAPDLQRDGDLLFGCYSETVTMIYYLEQIGLNIEDYYFPTVSEATNDLCAQMLQSAVYNAKYQNGTLGMLAEKLWTECRTQTLVTLTQIVGDQQQSEY